MQPPDDDDDDAAMSGQQATSLYSSSIPPTTLGNHQESDKFIEVLGKKKKSILKNANLGHERTTRYKYRLQVHLTISQSNNGSVNAATLQKQFVDQIYSIDNTTLIFKWNDNEKSNPLTKANQLPTSKTSIEQWISGTNAFQGPNNNNILKFYILIETSRSFMSFKEAMKPWLDYNSHRMWITKLSTTNNRTLAWLKFAHPEWSRYDELKKNLSKLIIDNSSCQSCEIDLRPRKSRVGRGPNAVLIYAITISCSVSNVEAYMEAMIKGFSQPDLIAPLRHIEIIPFQGITKLISNETVIAHANEHNKVIPRLHKRSIYGYSDIFTKLPTDEHPSRPVQSKLSIHEQLLTKKSKETEGPLFHSIESRGSSGFLIIFFDSYLDEVIETIDNLKTHLEAVFPIETVQQFMAQINTNSYQFLNNQDAQSEVSELSTAETYYTKIKPGSAIFIPPISSNPSENAPTNANISTTQPKQTYINITYGDEISSLGSRSAQHSRQSYANAVSNNSATSPYSGKKVNFSPLPASTSDDTTIASMKSEIQSMIEASRRDMDTHLKTLIQQHKTAQDKIDSLKKQHEVDKEHQKKELEDYKTQFMSQLLQEVSQCVHQSVKAQFNALQEADSMAESPVRSPVRKLPKNTDCDFSSADSITESTTNSPDTNPEIYNTPVKPRKTRSKTGTLTS